MYSQVLKIPNAQLAEINRYLTARSWEEYQGEDRTITNTAHFPDGKEMDIKCCGCKDGSSWTEAVLFDAHGVELTCTEVCEAYVGIWTLECDGVAYTVNVIAAGDDGTVNQGHAAVGGIQVHEPYIATRLVFPDSREFTSVNIFAGSLEEAKEKVHTECGVAVPVIKEEDRFHIFCFATDVYVKTLSITQADLMEVGTLLMSEAGSTDREIAHTITFPDEIAMQVKCYNGEDGAYAYGVLYDHGQQCGITEEYSEYMGLWEMSKGSTLYVANVIVE